MQKSDLDKTSKLEALHNQITQFRDEQDRLEQKVKSLNQKIEDDKHAFEEKESEMISKINQLTEINEKLNKQHEVIA